MSIKRPPLDMLEVAALNAMQSDPFGYVFEPESCCRCYKLLVATFDGWVCNGCGFEKNSVESARLHIALTGPRQLKMDLA